MGLSRFVTLYRKMNPSFRVPTHTLARDHRLALSLFTVLCSMSEDGAIQERDKVTHFLLWCEVILTCDTGTYFQTCHFVFIS